ncbi:MAG: alpha/beta hydrolase, partial [Actinobacteria bacterium]|nr:alpha/beta hydrolase [Actinomycetota bacterium]
MLRKMYLKSKFKEYEQGMSELFADCDERSVESFDGTRIAYRTVGEGLPLVVCPGVFTSYMFFHYMKDYFSPRHQVILWDYRGHPESEVPADLDSITIGNCARDLKAVLDDAGVDKAILIGFSMGVMTILEFYKRYRKRVLGLIPINGPYAEGLGFVSESEAVQDALVSGLEFISGHTWLVEWFRPILVLPINIPIAKRVELNPTLCPEEDMKLYFDYVAMMNWHAGFQALAAMGRYDGTGILDKVKV